RSFQKAVHMEAKQLWDAGAYTDASKGSPIAPGSQEIQFSARDDKVICLSSTVLEALGKKAQALKVLDNQLADFGWGIKKLLEDQLGVSLTKRTPGMLSCYDGKAVPDAQYAYHVDNPYLTNMSVPDDGRRLTLIYYVADGPWDVHKDGGALQVCLSDPRRAPSSTAEALSHPFFTVAPDCDTLVAFWSHTMFHAVLPVTGTKPRFALSTWFMGD
ncbi:Hypoxia-inducible factor prolyl hydroxylase (HIF-PH) (Egg-laying defective protein 9) (Hypoxia-inducible factor-proline dioxygenase), partial [Durusdinium trenchii]